MATFTKFNDLPLELQDMIWKFSIPGPRVIEYRSETTTVAKTKPTTPSSSSSSPPPPPLASPAQPTDHLHPFAPALFSVCVRSRHWTSQHYTRVSSPSSPAHTIGFLDFTRDTLLLSSVPEAIFAETTASGIDHSAAQRMDLHLATSLLNTYKTWSQLRFLAISVPVFLVTLWSGRSGLAREQSSPVLNALYELPALQGIAIVSSGARELESVVVGDGDARPAGNEEGQGQGNGKVQMQAANWDQRNVWRFLTANEAEAGWAKLFRENLVDNFSLEKEDEGDDAGTVDGDDADGASESWEEVKRCVWGVGGGPQLVHIGLETEATRREIRQLERAPRRSERLKIQRKGL